MFFILEVGFFQCSTYTQSLLITVNYLLLNRNWQT